MDQKVIQLEKVVGLVRNAKDHDIGGIIVAIRRFGFIHPLVINKVTGHMIAGHGRVEALRVMKVGGEDVKPKGVIGDEYQWFVPYYECEIDESEEEAAGIALNRLEELGGWNEGQLVKVLSDLAAQGEEMLQGIGWDEDDLDAMLKRAFKGSEEKEEKENKDNKLCCEDCGTLYPCDDIDVTLPDNQWLMIHPESEGGILCGGCMVKRASNLPGIIAVRMKFDFGE